MKVITRTLDRQGSSLSFYDHGGGRYVMTAAEWMELGKPDRIVVQISTPDLTQEDPS